MQQYSPNVTPSVWLAPYKWAVHLTVNKPRRYAISFAKIQQWVSGACYLCYNIYSVFKLYVCCVYLCHHMCKKTRWYCLRKTKAHSPWGFWCLDIIRFFCHQCRTHCLPREHSTKHSMRQGTHSKDGQGSQYQLCSECHYLWSAYWDAPRASTRACCVFCLAVSCLSTHFQGKRWKCTIGA